LVEFAQPPGRWLVCTLEPAAPTPSHRELFRTLFRQLGVAVLDPQPIAGGLLNPDGVLTQALVLGPFVGPDYPAAFQRDWLGGESKAEPVPGARVGESEWRTVGADAQGIFAFNALTQAPGASNHVAYLSFRVFSPRNDELLENPRGAKLDLIAGSDDGVRLWLNGRLVLDDPTPRPLRFDDFQLTQLSLRRGWNHFLVKVANTHGDWRFRARLQCADPTLAPLVRTALAPRSD
jgi:hypothetical protein